jgi:hypothetical protein
MHHVKPIAVRKPWNCQVSRSREAASVADLNFWYAHTRFPLIPTGPVVDHDTIIRISTINIGTQNIFFNFTLISLDRTESWLGSIKFQPVGCSDLVLPTTAVLSVIFTLILSFSSFLLYSLALFDSDYLTLN